MLVEFRFRNYACFRDEQVLSMVASSDESLPDNVIASADGGKLRLLRSVAVYGPNASGKSTLLEAIAFVCDLVRTSASRAPGEGIATWPFALDPVSFVAPSQFEITFLQAGVRYQYGLAVTRQRVQSEYLYASPRGRTAMLFRRSWDQQGGEDDYRFGALLKGPNHMIRKSTRPNALFLSTAATLKHPQLSAAYAWFAGSVGSVSRPLLGWTVPTIPPEDEHHDQLRALLRLADLGISDYEVRKKPAAERGDSASVWLGLPVTEETRTEVWMAHPAAGGVSPSLPLSLESRGTQQVVALGQRVLEAIRHGRLLAVDELNAHLHPLLARSLVELYHNPVLNSRGAQLVLNTHDTALLDRSLFRRDQIYLTEKGQDGAAHLYSLAEYHSPRKEEALAKGYLQGRYGAIPFLGDPASLLAEAACP